MRVFRIVVLSASQAEVACRKRRAVWRHSLAAAIIILLEGWRWPEGLWIKS
jgi:hypothetical protein